MEGLRRVGIGTPLGLPFDGAADPIIRTPNKTNWSKTALAWMSIGYETQIPPISTVSFYNAIANGGKMVRPRFVKGISKKACDQPRFEYVHRMGYCRKDGTLEQCVGMEGWSGQGTCQICTVLYVQDNGRDSV